MNAPGGFRIEVAQQAMEGARFSALARGQAVAQGLISLRPRRQAIDQGAEVKTRTTSHHGQMPARRNLVQDDAAQVFA